MYVRFPPFDYCVTVDRSLQILELFDRQRASSLPIKQFFILYFHYVLVSTVPLYCNCKFLLRRFTVSERKAKMIISLHLCVRNYIQKMEIVFIFTAAQRYTMPLAHQRAPSEPSSGNTLNYWLVYCFAGFFQLTVCFI